MKHLFKKGHKLSEETKRKIGEANKIALKGNTPWNKGKKGVYSKETLEKWSKTRQGRERFDLRGKKRTPEQRRVASLSKIGIMAGEKHWNWKGGISPENHIIRQSFPYKEWRRNVFKRDGWTCVLCSFRSKCSSDIQADHIQPFAYYPELRLELSNGRTLCVPCHKSTETYKFRI